MKVAYLNLQRSKEGASFAHVHEIIKGLRRHGATVDLFEPDDNPSSVLAKTVSGLRTQVKLLRHLRSYDVVYMRMHVLLSPSVEIARFLGIPAVIEVNGPMEDVVIAYARYARLLPFLKRLAARQLKAAAGHAVVTPQLGEWVTDLSGRSGWLVAPNGADTEHFDPCGPVDAAVEGPYVCFFGALAPWQGLPSLLSATEDPAWPADLQLVVIGEGALAATTEQFAATSERVTYLGARPYEQLPAILRGATASIVSSLPRGGSGLAPIKLAESLAVGLPVVASDVPPMGEFVRNNECGVTYPPDDSSALASAVAELVADGPALKATADRARTAAIEHRSWDGISAATYQYLLDLVKGGRSLSA